MHWTHSSDAYVHQAIEEVERELAMFRQTLNKQTPTPLATTYRLKHDETLELLPGVD
jgi:hypothetical protein